MDPVACASATSAAPLQTGQQLLACLVNHQSMPALCKEKRFRSIAFANHPSRVAVSLSGLCLGRRIHCGRLILSGLPGRLLDMDPKEDVR